MAKVDWTVDARGALIQANLETVPESGCLKRNKKSRLLPAPVLGQGSKQTSYY